MAEPQVEVVIPTRNRQVELATTPAGLAAQTYQHFRVLVSDQSDDEPSYATEPEQTAQDSTSGWAPYSSGSHHGDTPPSR